jgi:hypothetical protein
MSPEKLFTRIVQSYKLLLSTSGSGAPGLRAYCKSRHVSYREFLSWSSTQEIASGIKEVERKKRRLLAEKDVEFSPCSSSSPPSCAGEPLLYPLHIITDVSNSSMESVVPSSTLSGVRIIFPNGIKLSIREADSSVIYSLVYGK